MKFEMFDLSGKVAVVVGGHSGIGRGIAEGLAEAGADIVIAARRFDRCQETCSELEKLEVKTLPVRCDATINDEVNNLVETTVREFGKLDILVYSAGVGGNEKPVLETTDEEWDETLNVNLRGAFLCCRAVAKEMVKQNGGKIINVASILGLIGNSRTSAYCTSKGGIIQLTKSMALELVRYNIQVNALCPGYFLTPMNAEFFSKEIGERYIKKFIPMGRLGRTDELKGIAIYLASPASSFTTGAAMVVDGGQTVW